MTDQIEQQGDHSIDLKLIDENSLELLRSDIISTDAIIANEIEVLTKKWLENQKSKRLYNAISGVVMSHFTPFTVLESKDFNDLISVTYNRISDPNFKEIIEQYDRQFDFTTTQLKQALFTILKFRREPPLFDDIIDNLDKFNFRAKSEHHRESVRTMLRYYSTKKNFIEVDENERWALTKQGEKFYADGIEPEAEIEDLPITVPRQKIAGKMSKFKQLYGETPLFIHCANIIAENGNHKMHASKIAKKFNEKFDQKFSASMIGNALRKNSLTKNPIIKAHGNNYYSLIGKSPDNIALRNVDME